MWYMYVLKCSDDSLYTGATNCLQRRLNDHNFTKKGARYTRSRRPVDMIFCREFETKQAAFSAEAKFKKLSRKKKIETIDKELSVKKDDVIITKTFAGVFMHCLAIERKIIPKQGTWAGYSGWLVSPILPLEIEELKEAGVPVSTPDQYLEEPTWSYDYQIISVCLKSKYKPTKKKLGKNLDKLSNSTKDKKDSPRKPRRRLVRNPV